MSTSLLALLDNSGFIVNGKPNISKIKDTPKSKLMRFCEEFSELTSYKLLAPQNSIYSHSASISLGAGRYPCASKICRISKAEQLAQFAAFYSNHVYVNNFMHSHVLHTKSSELRTDIIDDLTILSYLYPLVESDLISFVTYDDICPHCMAITSINENMGDQFKDACSYLEQVYLSEVKYTVAKEGTGFSLIAEGPELLIPHKTNWSEIDRKNKNFNYVKDIVGSKNTAVQLSLDQIKNMKINNDAADEIIRSIAIELSGAHHLKTSFLSESELEIGFLKQFTGSQLNIKRASLMEKYLTCFVPFLSNVNTKDIIKLRSNENDSFIVFRQSLSKAIDEYKYIGESFSEEDAMSLYSDVVEPSIAKLEMKFNGAKRSFAKDTTREILSWVGAISAGFYTGAFMSSLLAGSAALASAKIGADIVKNIMAKSDAEEIIKHEDMFFLWKIKQLAK